MSVWKSILSRLNNRGTIVALAALIVSLLCQFGLDINSWKYLSKFCTDKIFTRV